MDGSIDSVSGRRMISGDDVVAVGESSRDGRRDSEPDVGGRAEVPGLLPLRQLHGVITDHHRRRDLLSVADSRRLDARRRHLHARHSAAEFHCSRQENSRHSGRC